MWVIVISHQLENSAKKKEVRACSVQMHFSQIFSGWKKKWQRCRIVITESGKQEGVAGKVRLDLISADYLYILNYHTEPHQYVQWVHVNQDFKNILAWGWLTPLMWNPRQRGPMGQWKLRSEADGSLTRGECIMPLYPWCENHMATITMVISQREWVITQDPE